MTRPPEHPPLFAWLAGAGALPLIACATLRLAGVDSLEPVGDVQRAAALYGVVIAAFMAGVHWGTYLYNAPAAPTNLFLTSNAIAVFVWLCYLLGGVGPTLLGLVAAFAVLLAIDAALYRSGLLSRAYFRTRCGVTAVVGGALIATLL